jgi:hypothetical protein
MTRCSGFLRIFSALSVLLAGAAAQAATTSDVGSPVVKAGVTEFSARAGYSIDDDLSAEDERFRTRFHLDHGFNDFYAARILVAEDKRKGDDGLEHESFKIENRFYLLKADQCGFDFGARFGYTRKDGDKKPDNVEFGLYELVPHGPWELRLNQIFTNQIGDGAEKGLEAEWRTQVTHAMAGGFRLGLEAFHEFGNLDRQHGFDQQSHTLGPVVKGTVFGTPLEFEAGYRVGLSEAAPDHTFKLFFAYKF